MSNQAEARTIVKGFESEDPKKRINADKICDIHNEQYREISFDKYVCLSCASAEEDKEKLQRRVSQAVQSLSLPTKLERYSFENYKATGKSTVVLDKCKKYVQSWPDVGGIIMLGGVGTGKTHLAVSICKDLCAKGVVSHFTTANKIIRSVRSSWGNNKPIDGWGEVLTEEKIINRFVGYDLLVIDEIGTQYGSESERIIINEIINDRYEMDRQTVLIGNVSFAEAEKILGSRVIDRVKDNGEILFFEWDSFRRSK